jgi:MYXO-CTERM domain-containing protein
LVEYWEHNPCEQLEMELDRNLPPQPAAGMAPPTTTAAAPPVVQVLAKFVVGEYDIVILGASDSTGLETWLHQHKYKIPKGSEPYLRPYVANGSKFFVAKVNSQKVKFENGRARLSPLRFHYNSDQFSLPVRLGLINAQGKQELIVHILSPGKRFEVANYPNAVIPTNLNVSDAVRKQFGTFYAALFDKMVERNPKSVVTEYSWDAGSCDPCPTPPLNDSELKTLGSDVLPAESQNQGMVLTRLHARYSKESFSEDLVFKETSAIVGGREFGSDAKGNVEQGFRTDSSNNFQARYVIRHAWQGAITCDKPRRGIWGGPPPKEVAAGNTGQPKAATDIAFVTRGPVDLASLVWQPVPELGLHPGMAIPPAGSPPGTVARSSGSSCSGCSVPNSSSPWPWVSLSLLGLGLYWRRRNQSDRG